MAVIQISKIQVRRGLQENLPSLSPGEFGWSVDQRRLYIGNGTLAEGSPATGVTEVLTEFNSESLSANVTALESNVTVIQSQLGVPRSSETLTDNTTANTSVLVESLKTEMIDYNIVRGTDVRIGTLKIGQYNGTAGTVNYEDDYTETSDVGVTWDFAANATSVVLQYTTTSTGDNATFNYFVRTFG